MILLKLLYRFIFINIPTLYYSIIAGIPFNKSNQIQGRLYIVKRSRLISFITKQPKGGSIIIGNDFKCNNKITSNSIGLIQPCIFNISSPNSKIVIGNNVGISGSTVNATTTISIGNNVLIGSGCLITDTDSHPINYEDRINNRHDKISKLPITIKDNVFIGARTIITKGVCINEGAIIGAGSVVTKDVAPNTIFGGNPAKFIKNIK